MLATLRGENSLALRDCTIRDMRRNSAPSRSRAPAPPPGTNRHLSTALMCTTIRRIPAREIGNLLPNNQHQRRTWYALCHILYPVSAAHTSIWRVGLNSAFYDSGKRQCTSRTWTRQIDSALRVARSEKSAGTVSRPAAARLIWRSLVNTHI